MVFDSDPLILDVYYCDNNGSDWTTLATGITLHEFSWNTTQHDDGNNYMIQVVVSDEELTIQDVSDSQFSLDDFVVGEELPFDSLTIIVIAAAAVVIIIVVCTRKKR